MKKQAILIVVIVSMIALTGCSSIQSFTQGFIDGYNSVSENNREEQGSVASEKQEFVRGEFKDNLYVNEFMGVSLTIPNGWLQSGGGMTHGGADGKEVSTSEEVRVRDQFKGTSVHITIKLLSSVGLKSNSTSEECIKYMEKQVQLELPNVEIGQPEKTSIANEQYEMLNYTDNVSGKRIRQFYLSRIKNSYLITIIGTFADEETQGAKTLQAYFNPITK